MNDIGKYCCFLDPQYDKSEKSLESLCPKCGKPYGFPLLDFPEWILDYRVIKSKGRGFYAATFLCEQGNLNQKYVLKVASQVAYEFFNKNFEDECITHMKVAADSEHIVPIRNYFDQIIKFDSIAIPCHVAVIDYIEGQTLEEYLSDNHELPARSLAQIAIDLFRIWREFNNKLKYHNDLHANNIIVQRLKDGARRAEAIEGSIRAIAIDLGSVSDDSKSDPNDFRFSDQHWLWQHLKSMLLKIREKEKNIDLVDDLDNRIAEAFERVLNYLLPAATNGRIPSADELIMIVKDYFQSRGTTPWRNALRLERLDDSYNAISLEPWFVPLLLVDPDGLWLKTICAPGPMIITGMRGCGKTMLLRALDIHARAAMRDGEQTEHVLKRLKEDGYIGLFASCISLLTIPGRPSEPTASLERLFLAYCREIIRGVRHLSDIDTDQVVSTYYDYIAEAIQLNMDCSFDKRILHSDQDLDRYIRKTIADISTSAVRLTTPPAEAFSSLAEAVKKCSYIWANSKVFFLLDDVSTRYLDPNVIEPLLSSLIFQNSECAFKLTTEAQTIEMVLRSPGLVEPARIGRDYDIFDLGYSVYEKTKEPKIDHKLFVEQILEQRVRYYVNHPPKTPRDVLGDCSLINIARTIASSTPGSLQKKAIYHGIRALSAVCVGDIGDVISIYDQILQKENNQFPVRAEVQSQCYLDFCHRRLYDLNKRDGNLKDVALTFAKASNELLRRSYLEREPDKQERLRQYTSIFVEISSGDTDFQFEWLRKLIDAGVFVLHGGASRAKNDYIDPIKQFKLTYRKLFGLSSFIGLSDRDRYELSGQKLDEWVKNSDRGFEILIENLGGIQKIDDVEEEECEESQEVSPRKPQTNPIQVYSQSLFSVNQQKDQNINTEESNNSIFPRLNVEELTAEQLSRPNIELAILGLGFEQRTLDSANRWLLNIAPKRAIVIEYPNKGKSKQIRDLISKRIPDVSVISYQDILVNGLDLPPVSTFIDITGLAKPALFWAIRSALMLTREVWFGYTRAQEYYPRDKDLEEVLTANESKDYNILLESLSKVLTGERGPYKFEPLIRLEADESLRKVLCAFASAKHERLLSLLDYREYDRLEIAIPNKGTPRRETARIAAKIAAWNLKATGIMEVNTNNLTGIINWLIDLYISWYVDKGYNVEFGLTGSKIQAVACAAVSVEYKIAQCWYVQPEGFDSKRFTKGTGESQYFRIGRNSME